MSTAVVRRDATTSVEPPMGLGKRLKQARIAAGLKQADLAKRAGMTQAAVSALEQRDSESSRHAVKLAKALSIDPEWLTNGDAGKKRIDNRQVKVPVDSELEKVLQAYEKLDSQGRAALVSYAVYLRSTANPVPDLKPNPKART